MQLFELLRVHHIGRLAHQVHARERLGEGDHIADVLGAHQMHDQAVEPEGDAAVGWGAVAERVEEEAELELGFFRAKPEQLEDLALDLLIVDTDRAAADLGAVADHVVAVGQDRLDRVHILDVGVHEALGLFLGRGGEGVVQGVVALSLLVVLEHREVVDPEEVPLVFGDVPVLAGDLEAQLAQRLGDDGVGVGPEDNRVAILKAESLDQLVLDVGEELGDAGGELAAGVLDGGHAARAELLGEGVELVRHFAAELLSAAGHAYGLDDALGLGERIDEHAEPGFGGQIGDIDEFEIKAGVRAIDAVSVHGLAVGHAGEVGEIHAEHLLPDAFGEALHDVEHLVAVDEAHLKVDLGELGLAVGAWVLVAEALDDLEVAVAAADHEDLLEELRRLGQGVPHARLVTRGHEKVPRPLGRGAAQHGRLDLDEVVLVEVIPCELGHAVTRPQDVLHRRATQVDVAIPQANLLVGQVLLGAGDERELLGFAQTLHGCDEDLDGPGGDLVVLGCSLADGANDLDAVLIAELGGLLDELGVVAFGLEDGLGEP